MTKLEQLREQVEELEAINERHRMLVGELRDEIKKKDAECQARVEFRLLEIEEWFFTEDANGWLALKDTLPPSESVIKWWQVLKKKEGIDEKNIL